MRRALFNLAAGVSVVLFLVVLGAWLRSYAPSEYGVYSRHGRLTAVFAENPTALAMLRLLPDVPADLDDTFSGLAHSKHVKLPGISCWSADAEADGHFLSATISWAWIAALA